MNILTHAYTDIETPKQDFDLFRAGLSFGLPRLMKFTEHHTCIPDSVLIDAFKSVLGAVYHWGRELQFDSDFSSRLIIDLLSTSKPSLLPPLLLYAKENVLYDASWRNLKLDFDFQRVFPRHEGCLQILLLCLPLRPQQLSMLAQVGLQSCLSCALFNSPLPDEEHSFSLGSFSLKEFDKLSKIRGLLCHLGAQSLKLLLSEDIYTRFGSTSSFSELVRLLEITLSHDVLACVMVKKGIHRALRYTYESPMKRIFAEHGRWDLWVENDYTETCTPQPLSKHDPRTKCRANRLSVQHTKALAASFQMIVGALVVGVGVDSSFQMMRLIFDDVFLLIRLNSATNLESLLPSYRESTTKQPA